MSVTQLAADTIRLCFSTASAKLIVGSDDAASARRIASGKHSMEFERDAADTLLVCDFQMLLKIEWDSIAE